MWSYSRSTMQSAHAFVVQVFVPVDEAVLVEIYELESQMCRVQIVLRHVDAELTPEFISSHIHKLLNRYFMVLRKQMVKKPEDLFGTTAHHFYHD